MKIPNGNRSFKNSPFFISKFSIFHCFYFGVPFGAIIYHVPTENIRNIAIFAGSKMCVCYVVCLGLNISKIKKRISVLFGCKNGFTEFVLLLIQVHCVQSFEIEIVNRKLENN